MKTEVFYKPTDTHSYVPFDSCHPRNTKINIPYSQARRLCTIIDDEDILNMRLNEMRINFLRQKYPKTVIDNAISQARKLSKDELLKKKDSQSTNIIPFIYTHNPNNPYINNSIRAALDVLQTSDKMKYCLKDSKLIMSKRQSPNLKNILTNARFDFDIPTFGSFKCNDKRCGTCPHLLEKKQYKFNNSDKPFHIKSEMNCSSSNVIYCLICSCGKEYIGLTTTSLRKRVTVHKQQIKRKVS